MNELLYDTSDALARIADPKVRNAIAQKLFDSEGVGLARVLDDGSEAMRALGDEAERLGVVTDEQARAGERYTDELGAMRRAVEFLGHTLGIKLLPRMERAIRAVREWAVAVRPAAVRELEGAMRDLDAVVGGLAAGFGWLRSAGLGVVERLYDAVPALRGFIDWARRTAENQSAFRLAIVGVSLALSGRLMLAIVGLFLPLARLALALALVGLRMTWLTGVGIARLGLALFALARNWRFAAFAVRYFLVTAAGGAFVRLAGAVRGIGAAGAWLAAILGRPLVRALGLAARAAAVFGVALMATPIGWIALAIAAVAGAAYLVYRHWNAITDRLRAAWRRIKAAVPIGEWIARLRRINLLGAVRRWWQGVVGWVSERWAALKAAVPIGEWIDDVQAALDGVDLMAVGTRIVDSLMSGLRSSWESVEKWFRDSFATLREALPDFVLEQLGWEAPAGELRIRSLQLDPRDQGGAAGISDPGAAAWAEPAPMRSRGGDDIGPDMVPTGGRPAPVVARSIFDRAGRDAEGGGIGARPAGGRDGRDVRGEIVVRFENAPRGTRARIERSEPAVPLAIDLGWATE